MKVIIYTVSVVIFYVGGHIQAHAIGHHFNNDYIQQWQQRVPEKPCKDFCYQRATSDCVRHGAFYCTRKRDDCLKTCETYGENNE